jgi:hypothetical protein
MSPVAVYRGSALGPHYAASKAGLLGLAHDFAARLASSGVTGNALAPALIADAAMVASSPALLRQMPPIGRFGDSAEVADLALAVLANGYLTNQAIGLDGGIHPLTVQFSEDGIHLGQCAPPPARAHKRPASFGRSPRLDPILTGAQRSDTFTGYKTGTQVPWSPRGNL